MTLHMKSMGWGGVGWGMLTFVGTCTWCCCYAMILRWNLYMMLRLRDDPSLELVHDLVLLPFMWPCTWSWWGGVGWGGVGRVNVRWNLYMMLLLRDDPSLKLVHDVAATRWSFVGTCTWRCLVAVHMTLHMKLMGWGRVGWGGVGWGGACQRSLELVHDVAATRWSFVGTCTWCCGYAMILRWNLYMTLSLETKSTKGFWKYIRSFQWRWGNQIDLLSATAKALQNL